MYRISSERTFLSIKFCTVKHRKTRRASVFPQICPMLNHVQKRYSAFFYAYCANYARSYVIYSRPPFAACSHTSFNQNPNNFTTKECSEYLAYVYDTEQATSKMGEKSDNLFKVSNPLNSNISSLPHNEFNVALGMTNRWIVCYTGIRKDLLPTAGCSVIYSNCFRL